jgi:hypothetical protein
MRTGDERELGCGADAPALGTRVGRGAPGRGQPEPLTGHGGAPASAGPAGRSGGRKAVVAGVSRPGGRFRDGHDPGLASRPREPASRAAPGGPRPLPAAPPPRPGRGSSRRVTGQALTEAEFGLEFIYSS